MWFLPTYNRPEKLKRFLAAAKATGISTPGIVIVNGDFAGYENLDLPENWTLTTASAEGMVKVLNDAFDAHPNEMWYGIVVDDLVPVTPGWDKAVVQAALKSGIASCNDRELAPARMTGATAFRGDILRAAGFVMPRCLFHTYGDDFWEKIGRDYACWSVLMDVIIEHHHPFKDAASADATHARSYSQMGDDKGKYQRWLFSDDGRATVQRIASVAGVKQRTVDLKGKSVAFGTPAYGGQFAMQYVKSLAYSAAQLESVGIPFWTIFVGNDSLIHKARNGVVRSFLEETEATHLLFADADMGWDPESVLRLLSHEKDVVAGAGMRKQDPASFCFRPSENRVVCPDTGCWEVEAIGTGFMMISRDCITRMIARYPELRYTDNEDRVMHALFYNEMKYGKDWSEDYVFCRRWREMGGQIWMDPTVALDHVGQRVWSGSVSREAMIVREQEKA